MNGNIPLRRWDKEPTEENLLDALQGNAVERNEDVIKLLKILDSIEGPYSIFLDSPWGDGKTFLVKQAEIILKLANEHLESSASEAAKEFWAKHQADFSVSDLYLPVYFNAWENDDYADPLLPLLATMATQCKFIDTKATENLASIITSLIDSSLGLFGYDPHARQLVDSISSNNLLEEYIQRKELRDKFDFTATEALREQANKLVLFIDELDRCHPAFAVKLLEQTKTLFNNENTILVFSTDACQLAHAIKGLYGNSFSAEKYLERFYDLKYQPSPVNCLKYLRELGYDSEDHYYYTSVANGFISLLEPNMREANRLCEHLKRGQEYVHNSVRDVGPGNAIISIAESILLPTFIVMSYDNYGLWRNIKDKKQFEGVYEYGKRNQTFIEALNAFLSNDPRYENNTDTTDKTLQTVIEHVCAMVFIDDHMDQRLIDAYNVLKHPWNPLNKQVIRSLALEE